MRPNLLHTWFFYNNYLANTGPWREIFMMMRLSRTWRNFYCMWMKVGLQYLKKKCATWILKWTVSYKHTGKSWISLVLTTYIMDIPIMSWMLKYILPIYHGVITFNIYILEGFFNVWLICTTCVYTSCIDTSHWKIICHITKPCFEMIYRYNKSTK